MWPRSPTSLPRRRTTSRVGALSLIADTPPKTLWLRGCWEKGPTALVLSVSFLTAALPQLRFISNPVMALLGKYIAVTVNYRFCFKHRPPPWGWWYRASADMGHVPVLQEHKFILPCRSPTSSHGAWGSPHWRLAELVCVFWYAF